MAIDFPDNPTDLQGYQKWVYHASSGTWKLKQDNFATVTATGGTTYNVTNAFGKAVKIHVFTSSGDFVVTDPGNGVVKCILIGGGGAGGAGYSSNPAESAGGGGGGVLFSSVDITAGTYPVVIGAGGAPAGSRGQDTTFGGRTAFGGGSGLRIFVAGQENGGSGGGGTGSGAGTGVDGQGRAGGTGASLEGGGGGGFGAIGGNTNNTPAGDGTYLGPWIGAGSGYGLPGLSFADGWFSGGGPTRSVARGLGTDSVYGANATSTPASANTGGGGAGSYGSPGSGQTGSAGGSGIAFIYYEVEA